MKKRLLACLLSMLMLVGMVPVSVSAATSSVVWSVSAGENVQTVIDGATAGDTIKLAAGEYESFVVNKTLTITAADPANKPIIKVDTKAESRGEYNSCDGIVIKAENVTLDNLVIKDAGFNTGIWCQASVTPQYNSSISISGLTVSNCDFKGTNAPNFAMAASTDTYTFTNNTVEGYKNAIFSMSDGGVLNDVIITGNTFDVSNKVVNGTYWGVAGGKGNFTYSNNTIVSGGSNVVELIDYANQKGEGVAINVVTISGDADVIATRFDQSTTINLSNDAKLVADPSAVATVNGVSYFSLDEAFDAASANGDTVSLLAGEYDAFTVPKTASGITIAGTLDAAGNKLTTIKTNEDVYTHNTLSGIYMMADDVTFADLKFTSGKTQKSWMDGAISTYNEKYGNFNSLTIDNCDFVGSGVGFAISAAKQFGDLTITNTTITNYNKGVYIYGLAAGATMTITDSEIEASNRVIHFEESTATSEVVVSGSTLVAPHLSFGGSAVSTINNCEIETTFWIYGDLTITATKLVDCKYNTSSTASITLGSDAATANYISNPDDVAAATEKGENVGPLYPYYQDASRTKLIRSEEDVTAVAYIGETPYQSLEDAINALGGAGTIQLVADCAENITLSLGDAEAYNITITLADGIEFSGSIDAADDDTSVVISTADGLITVAVAAAPKSVVSKPTFDYVLFALAARYSQRFDVLVSAENATVTGDLVIKYKRSGTVDIDVADGYQIVDVIANGQSLGAVESVTFKKVMTDQTLVVVTELIPTEETPAVNP